MWEEELLSQKSCIKKFIKRDHKGPFEPGRILKTNFHEGKDLIKELSTLDGLLRKYSCMFADELTFQCGLIIIQALKQVGQHSTILLSGQISIGETGNLFFDQLTKQ